MRKQKSFLRKVQLLQSTGLVLVILVMLSLIRMSAIFPGLSTEADQAKAKVKQKTYEKEYVRGSILDRNGQALAWSKEAGGPRYYGSKRSCSSLLGYYSIIYGTSGLESKFNDLLSHSASSQDHKRGADLTLTIDKKLQDLAYHEIKDITGSVVVLDAKTGEILALTSSPSYNASALEEKWEQYNKKEGVFLSNAFQNPVTPGSVFKLVASQPILEEGLDSKWVEDEGSLKVNGQTIHNYNDTAYGSLNWEEGFINSSNVYFMSMMLEMGGQKLTEAAEAFMLGEEIALDFTTLKSSWDLDINDDNMVAATAFGQGNTLITPLHMAMITQSIANDGKMLKPYLIQSVTDGKGRIKQKGEKWELKETMSQESARKLREAMTKAGNHYDLSWIGEENYQIAAKTGTAQIGNGKNNAWMVSFAPAEDPRYVVVVNRLGTEKIGKTLAPVIEELYEALLEEETF